jgi:hypothetical protein
MNSLLLPPPLADRGRPGALVTGTDSTFWTKWSGDLERSRCALVAGCDERDEADDMIAWCLENEGFCD